MSDIRSKENKQEIFSRCTHINVHIIACLRARRALNRSQVSQILGEKSLIKRSHMVFEWIEESQEFCDHFLRVMENNGQEHVSNLLKGIQDGPRLPLSLSRYNRLEIITPKLMLIIRNDEELIATLRAKSAISEIDRQDITQVSKEYERNWSLIEAILRRSDYAFHCLEQALRETLQYNVANYLQEGQVISVHVNTTQPEKDKALSDLINATILEESKDDPSSSEEKIFATIKESNIHPVTAKLGQSIVFFVYCKTVGNVITLTKLFISGDLQNMIEIILNRLLSKIDPVDTKQLKARLSLDAEYIPAVEKYSGIEDWMPAEFEEAATRERIVNSVGTQTEHQNEDSNVCELFSDGSKKITTESSVCSGATPQTADDDSGFGGWSHRTRKGKRLEEIKTNEQDLDSSEDENEGKRGKLHDIQEYVNKHDRSIGYKPFSAPSSSRVGLLKLSIPENIYTGGSSRPTTAASARYEDYFYMKRKLEQTQKENDKLMKLLEHRSQTGELHERYISDPDLVKTISSNAAGENYKPIHGLAICDKELFAVIRESSEVEVYDSVKFSFSRRWNLKELIRPLDIVSCNRNKCLYIFDFKSQLHVGQSNEILKVEPNGKLVGKWSTGEDYGFGLSVTDELNIILAVYNKTKLNEYSPDGELMREIDLSSVADICAARHAIKLTNGDFLVSYCLGDDLHTVCVVDADGKPGKSFCEKCRSIIGEMNGPVYLLVDGNGFVVVVDRYNSRVLLLDSDLEFKREILSKERHGLRHPERILIDESNGRLFVADNEGSDGRILIFSLSS